MKGAGGVGDIKFMQFNMRIQFAQFRNFSSQLLQLIVRESKPIIQVPWLGVLFPVNDSSSHDCYQTSNFSGKDPLLLWLIDNYILLINLFLLYSSAQYLDTRTSHKGDDQFVAANKGRYGSHHKSITKQRKRLLCLPVRLYSPNFFIP